MGASKKHQKTKQTIMLFSAPAGLEPSWRHADDNELASLGERYGLDLDSVLQE